MTWPELLEILPILLAASAGGALVVMLVVLAARFSRRRRVGSRDLATLRSDVADLAGQLEDYARQIDRQVAERMEQLEGLVAEADGTRQELERLLAAGRADRAGEPAPRLRERQVLTLAAEGLDAIEIARRLRMDVGEVELMLNLHRSRTSGKA